MIYYALFSEISIGNLDSYDGVWQGWEKSTQAIVARKESILGEEITFSGHFFNSGAISRLACSKA